MAKKPVYDKLGIRVQEPKSFLAEKSDGYQPSENTLPDLADIVDMQVIQSLMNHFYTLTNIGVAILDLKGNILVATGWQDICTRFHRVHPETCKNCLESDLILSNGIKPGTFKLYRCNNHMWDMATPIMAGTVKVGNLFLGQFFFEDELPDIKTFREQARRYGFDENKYLSALEKVPRWTRQTVNEVMEFYAKLANLISDLGFRNLLLNKSEEMLSRCVGEEHKKIAKNVFDLINQSIQTSRSLTTELYPPVLQQGLSAALQWTVRWMNENHGLTIDLHTDPDIDPEKEDVTAFLYQSTRELLLNVIKHSGVKSARLEMTCNEEQKQLRVTVSDNGSGFDPGAVLKDEGTGFGLFSIQERLQLMGGSIQIESSPGNGASLSLIVPLEKKEEKKDDAIRAIKTEDKITKTGEDIIRTLVVDDHTVVRQGISALLSLHSDIEMVGEAGDGQEAVEKARQLQPDVILMDISMPRMDGIQATRIIRSELPCVRIVGLSMHDKQDQADQMIQAGASAYCTKDGSTDELLFAIRRLD